VHGGASFFSPRRIYTDPCTLEEAVQQAQAATRALYEINPGQVSVADVENALLGDSRLVHARMEDMIGVPLTKLMASSGKVKSRGEFFSVSIAKSLKSSVQ